MMAQVPLLKQWDERWADYPYGGSSIAVSGCGPTCFAMVAQYYGVYITPPEAADFAVAHGYYPSDGGTSWDFFAAAGRQFGVPMQITFDPDVTRQALAAGYPCIGAHGPGEFTAAGHFIVYAYMTENLEVMINDPNREETCRLYSWNFLVQDNSGTGGFVAFVPEGVR